MDRVKAKEEKRKRASTAKDELKILHGDWQTKHTGGLPGSEEKGSFWRSAEYFGHVRQLT